MLKKWHHRTVILLLQPIKQQKKYYHMKQKITTILSTLIIAMAMQMSTAKAQQAVLFSENFDSALPNHQYPLPTGWHCTKPTTNVLDSLSWGYHIDSTGFSSGTYSNAGSGYGAGMADSASGKNHIAIKNVEDSTGWFNLYMPSISTVGKTGISMMWASRISNSFITDGSAIPQLWFSVDNGTTWDSISHQDSPGASAWGQVNGGVNIAFPTKAENKASLQIRFTQFVHNFSGGTYRIDDVWLWSGGVAPSGIDNVVAANDFMIYPNPANDYAVISLQSSVNTITITNILGQAVKTVAMPLNINEVRLDTHDLNSGIYFVQAINSNHQIVANKKLIIE